MTQRKILETLEKLTITCERIEKKITVIQEQLDRLGIQNITEQENEILLHLNESPNELIDTVVNNLQTINTLSPIQLDTIMSKILTANIESDASYASKIVKIFLSEIFDDDKIFVNMKNTIIAAKNAKINIEEILKSSTIAHDYSIKKCYQEMLHFIYPITLLK